MEKPGFSNDVALKILFKPAKKKYLLMHLASKCDFQKKKIRFSYACGIEPRKKEINIFN